MKGNLVVWSWLCLTKSVTRGPNKHQDRSRGETGRGISGTQLCTLFARLTRQISFCAPNGTRGPCCANFNYHNYIYSLFRLQCKKREVSSGLLRRTISRRQFPTAMTDGRSNGQ